MDEIQLQDSYRSSSSSASSPATSRVPSSNFFYLRKPGSIRQPISFEDSPEWEETDADVRMEEVDAPDSLNEATTPGSPFSGLGHSLSSVEIRVAAIFAFISFTSLLSIAGVPAHDKEIKIYACEKLSQHSGTIVFLLGQLLSSIPFLFLISITSNIIFYFLLGLRDEFSLLMYLVLNHFICLLVNEGLIMLAVCICNDIFWTVLTLVSVHIVMMLSAGYLRIRNDMPGPVWKYPFSYIGFHTYSIQGILENEYIGTSFAVGQVRSITGLEAIRSAYDISPNSNLKWDNLLVLILMAVAYRFFVFLLLHFCSILTSGRRTTSSSTRI